MPPSANESSQRALSQFTHLKPTEPATTALGVAPGRALLDTPSPECSPTALEQGQWTRTPSQRKAEASQSQLATSKLKGKQPMTTTVSKRNGKNAANSSNANISNSTAEMGSQVDETGTAGGSGANTNQDHRDSEDEDEDEDEDEEISPEAIALLEAFLGHTVSHLSSKRLQDLFDSVPTTQTTPMETQVQPPTQEIAQSHAGDGLARRDNGGAASHAGSGSCSLSQKQNMLTSSSEILASKKRQLDTLDTLSVPKRVCISDNDDNETDDESDLDSNAPH